MFTERKPIINGFFPKSKEPQTTPQYWVRLEDVKPEDIDAIIKIYTEAKRTPVSDLYQVPCFEDLKNNLVLSSPTGYVQWVLKYRVSALEARRRINEVGCVFVRFTIASLGEGNEGYRDTPEGRQIQNGIDNIFNIRSVAINLSDLFKPSKRLIV